MLFKGKYDLPWMKAGSQTTKHAAICMPLWQYIAVLRGTVVLSVQLAWSYFAINHEYECYVHIVCLAHSKKQLGIGLNVRSKSTLFDEF